MLNQEWRVLGFYVSELDSNGVPFYQLLRKDLFEDYIVAGSRNAEDMNPMAEHAWNRMVALKSYRERSRGMNQYLDNGLGVHILAKFDRWGTAWTLCGSSGDFDNAEPPATCKTCLRRKGEHNGRLSLSGLVAKPFFVRRENASPLALATDGRDRGGRTGIHSAGRTEP